ncbi:MAG: Fic family protein, partial [Thermomicrobiales bacterium]
ANPLRDENALDSAITRARMAEYYEEADVIRQAALMAVGISQAQAFLDGNKRTALAATHTFHRRNGLRPIYESIEFARQLELVAEKPGERQAATAAFEAWLRERVRMADRGA